MSCASTTNTTGSQLLCLQCWAAGGPVQGPFTACRIWHIRTPSFITNPHMCAQCANPRLTHGSARVHTAQVYNYSTGSRPYWADTAARLVILAELYTPRHPRERLGPEIGTHCLKRRHETSRLDKCPLCSAPRPRWSHTPLITRKAARLVRMRLATPVQRRLASRAKTPIFADMSTSAPAATPRLAMP